MPSRKEFTVVLCTCFLIGVILLVVKTNLGQTPNKEETKNTISISILNSSLVEDKQYNIWFDIICNETEGDISISPTVGLLMMVDNENPEAQAILVDDLDLDLIKTHSFVWVVDKSDEVMLEKVDVIFENSVLLKSASIFAGFENEVIAFVDEATYNSAKEKMTETSDYSETEVDSVVGTPVQDVN